MKSIVDIKTLKESAHLALKNDLNKRKFKDDDMALMWSTIIQLCNHIEELEKR